MTALLRPWLASIRRFKAAWLLMAAAWLLLGLLGFWQFVQAVPFRMVGASAVIDDDGVLGPGRPIRVERRFCVSRDLVLTAHRSVVSHLVYTLPPATVRVPRGCHATVFHVELPPGFAPGNYVYHVVLEVPVNRLRTAWIELPDLPFRLMDRDGSVPADGPRTGGDY